MFLFAKVVTVFNNEIKRKTVKENNFQVLRDATEEGIAEKQGGQEECERARTTSVAKEKTSDSRHKNPLARVFTKRQQAGD